MRPAWAVGAVAFLLWVVCSPAGAQSAAATQSTSPTGTGLVTFVDQRAHELPATHWKLDVEFPLGLVERLWWDSAYIVTEPARWDAPDWARFGGFAAATGAGFAVDRTLDVESRVHHPRGATERHLESVEEFGDFAGIASLVGGSAALGLATGNDLAKQISVDAGEALALSAVMTASVKEIVGRERPNRGDGPFSFHPFTGNASFPSGHATAAFAMASVVSEHFENKLWMAVPAYALASAVALARTRSNAHFATDVIVGGAIGAATGREIVSLEADRLGREQAASSGQRISVEPRLSPGFSGVEFTLRF
jgi:membrane-associated phospholipid phosphatase